MLTALRLGNFKAIAETQAIPIKPLTLIFGANSAGKSSLIHGLLLARHALESNDKTALDAHRTAIGGDSVDLGGFRQYVHRRNPSSRMEWGAEIDVSRLEGRVAELLAPVSKVAVSLTVGVELDDKGEPARGATPAVMSYEIEADGVSLLRASRRRDGRLQLDRFEQRHEVFLNVLKAIVEGATTTETLTPADFEGLDEAVAELVPEVMLDPGSFLPAGLWKERKHEPYSLYETLIPISRGNRREDLAAALRLYLPRTLDDIIQGLTEAITEELKRVQYLGPLRSYPPRHLAFSQHHDPNWYAGGGYAWDVVRREEAVREAVNAWLGSADRLQTPYRLEVRRLYDLEDLRDPVSRRAYDYDVKLREWLRRDVEELLLRSGISETLSRELREAILERHQDLELKEEELENFDQTEELEGLIDLAAEGIESVNELSLIDLRTSTKVSHRDVGIGVSQVLPVLVGSFASKKAILAIEQPEIHLHPKLQAELGDVFINSALGEQQNTFLLETHSEHLILRLMRRMRDTSNGTLPEGLPQVHPSDVAILYVQPAPRQGLASIVRVLELDEEGQLLDPWPGGFFEEGFRERFA